MEINTIGPADLTKLERDKLRDCATYRLGGSIFFMAPATMERLRRKGLVREARGSAGGYSSVPGWEPTEAGYGVLDAMGAAYLRPKPPPG
jgi:hypothetical protein